MKIALINTLYPPYQVGGAERSVQILAEGLATAGHEPVVLTLSEGRAGGAETINGVRVYRVPLDNLYWPFHDDGLRPSAVRRALWHLRDIDNRSMARRVREILALERPHIVHSHNLAGFSVGVWSAAAECGLPIVHTTRDYSLMCPRGMYRNGRNCEALCPECALYASRRRRASTRVRVVVGISNFVLARHLRMGFFRSSQRVTVPNAVPVPHSSGRPLNTVAAEPSTRLRIGYLGRLDPHKGLQDVITVLRASQELQDQVELLVGGRGLHEHEERLRAAASGLCVRWLGFVRPDELFSQVEVVIVPSRWHEPFSRVIIEAYAHGKPVIAARRGGMPEIVEEARTGWLYDPDRPGDLAAAIHRAILERNRLGAMGRAALSKVQEFTVARHVTSYLQVYERALGGRRAKD